MGFRRAWLYHREKRWTYAFVGSAVPLFVGGALIAYFAMSRGLAYLLHLTPSGVLNLPPVSTYLGYFIAMLLGFGLAFELPLLLLMLNVAGVLKHEFFRKWRRYMIFGVFLFAGDRLTEPGPGDHAAARGALPGARGDIGTHHLGERQAPGQPGIAVRRTG